MSLGGGSKKESTSSSGTTDSQQYGSNVWGPQSPYLQNLYSLGYQNIGNNTGNAQAQGFLGTAQQSLEAANGTLSESSTALRDFINPTAQDPALQAYATNLGQQFNEQFLPGLQGDAALAGGLGGSRQQIGAALGAQRAMQTLGDFTAQTYAGQQERALAAAQGLAANSQGYNAVAGTGAGMADFARTMPWYNLSQYQGLLGAPVQQDLGGWSKGTQTSKGSGSGWNANVGLGGG